METEKIAVYFDGDGVRASDARFALEEIKAYGNIIINRVYRDWRNAEGTSLGDWQSASSNNGIAQVQCGRVNGKESTDIKLCVDLMKDLYTNHHITLFYIVTSDRDYRHVLPEVKVMNKRVHVIGPSDANPALKSHCDKYSQIELLRRATIRKDISLEETNSNTIIDAKPNPKNGEASRTSSPKGFGSNTKKGLTITSSTTTSSTTTSSTTKGFASNTKNDLTITSSPPKGIKEDPIDSLVKELDDSTAQKYNFEFSAEDEHGSGPWFLAQLRAAVDRIDGAPLLVTRFKEYLLRQKTDFDCRNYGYKRFQDFLQIYVLNLSDEFELSNQDNKCVYYLVRKKK